MRQGGQNGNQAEIRRSFLGIGPLAGKFGAEGNISEINRHSGRGQNEKHADDMERPGTQYRGNELNKNGKARDTGQFR